jgi:hypothetical protein
VPARHSGVAGGQWRRLSRARREDGSVLGRFNLIFPGNESAKLGYRVTRHVLPAFHSECLVAGERHANERGPSWAQTPRQAHAVIPGVYKRDRVVLVNEWSQEDYVSVERAGRELHARGWRKAFTLDEMLGAWEGLVSQVEEGYDDVVWESRMPRAEQLPASLGPLTRRQAIEVSHARFGSDMASLLSVLLPRSQRRSPASINPPPESAP